MLEPETMVGLVRLIVEAKCESAAVKVTIGWRLRGAWMVAVILAACSGERVTTLDQSYVEKVAKHPNVTITAPKELVGATLTIDASERRMLWPDTVIDSRRWTLWRRIFSAREQLPSAAKAYLELAAGKHALVITHDHYKEIVKTIDVQKDHQEVRVDADEVVPKRSSGENSANP